MNRVNVEALKALLDEFAEGESYLYTGGDALPAWLASKGVLVPASLSDEDKTAIYFAVSEEGVGGATVVGTLERIARGDPTA